MVPSPPDPPRRPDTESDLVFVDNADEARKPRPPKKRSRRPPASGSQRAPARGKATSSGAHPAQESPRARVRKSSGAHPKPPSGTHPAMRRPLGTQDRSATEQVQRAQTRRVPRRKRRDGHGNKSGSIRIPVPVLDRTGPDPHLRIDGDTSGRPFCLVSAVLDEPRLLSRGKVTVIGRGEDVDIRVRSNLVSREHAEICWDSEAFALVDLGSTNGTFLNGYPVRDMVPLRDGDTIYVGNFEILVKVLEPGTDPEAFLEGMTRKFNQGDH